MYIPKSVTLSKCHIPKARTVDDRIIYNSYLDTSVLGIIQMYMRIIILNTSQRTNAVNSTLWGAVEVEGSWSSRSFLATFQV